MACTSAEIGGELCFRGALTGMLLFPEKDYIVLVWTTSAQVFFEGEAGELCLLSPAVV